LRPTHAQRGFVARKTFCGREEAIARLKVAYAEPQAREAYRVLLWHGVGGQGKSALLREFEQFLELRRAVEINLASHRRVAWAKVDFDYVEHRAIDQALLSARLQLASRGRLRFPAFDTAFGRYFALTNPGVDLRKAHPELFRTENELLADLLGANKDAAELADEAFRLGTAATSYALPGVNLLYKYGARLTGWARDWWDRRGKAMLDGLDALRADQLLEKLPSLFGADIVNALADGHARRVVLLLDTYEALWRDRGLKDSVASLRVDAWIRRLIEDTPGVLVVVASRDRLRWDEIKAEWADIVAHHALDALGDADAEAFLCAVPIDDAAIRARIIANAAGLPFYLNVQAETFEDMVNAGRTPEPDQFGRTEREVLMRFLDHLSSDDELILRLAAYPLGLSEVTLADLAQRFLGGSAFVNWHRFENWSFITVNDEGTAAMHPLMQSMLLARESAERPSLYREVNEWLFAQYDAPLENLDPRKITGADEARALVALIYHVRLNPPGALTWLDRRVRPFQRAERWQAVARLWAVGASVAEQLFGDDSWALSYVEYHLAMAYHAIGWNADAESLLARAIARAAGDTTRPTRFDEPLQRLQMGIELETGRHGEAERRWESLARDEAGTVRTSAIRLLRRRANLMQALEQHDAALASYRVILRRCRRRRDPDGIASALHGLGFSYLQTGRFGLAENSLLKAIATREAIGDTQSHSASISLHALARVYLATERHDEAETLIGRVMAIQQETVGDAHPHHARAHHHLGQIAAHRGQFDHARACFERAREIFVAANLAEHHRWVRETDAALRALAP